MNKDSAALLSIMSNSILVFLKLVAGFMVGSVSIISEAIHSGIDLLASFIAFFSIKKASKTADEEHPFGHGKYENLSGFVEAILIFFAAALIIIEASKKIFFGCTIDNITIGLLVMLISAVVNLVISILLMKIAKKTNSIALEADAMHLFTDVITAFGVFLGLFAVKITGITLIDPLTALLVAFIIIKTSTNLTKKSIKDLVDSRLSDEDMKKIFNILNNNQEVKSYHRLRTRQCGDKKQIDLHVKLNSNFSLITAHNVCSELEKEINTSIPNSYVLIHPEPSDRLWQK